MIVCALGYGYLAQFVFKRICALGIKGIGVTSENINNNEFANITLINRDKIKEVLPYSTHLLITAPPDDKGCSIFNKFSSQILDSNIKSLIYISSTGVYGNHNGDWVNENSVLNTKSQLDKIRVKAEKQWKTFCRRNNLNLNIVRISGIYGPQRIIKINKKKLDVIIKKNHYFSRIHVLDAARLISKIILENLNDEIWNLADDFPSSRELFLLEAIKFKNIKNFASIQFEKYESTLSDKAKKFWLNNKRVSNSKVKKYFEYRFIFPNYSSGIKNLKEYL
ncbi:NAD-dependent epimerase/dehydratase family protein [Alphaproteobacteria bacterium]|nr:NAD-dependent epimerase/dehydratase family protein [Alphaproteobacteria bacterium]